MKCLIVQHIHEAALEHLADNGIEPVLAPRPDMEMVARLIPDVDAVITRDAGLTAPAIAAASRLRAVVVHGSGHNAVDTQAATAHGVLVANTPGLNATSVAELALGLAISAARGIAGGDRAERAGAAGFRESATFSELTGKTALIVGWGAIGSKLGRMLRAALGMTVLIHSPRARDTGDFPHVDLADGLAQADVVSLNTPLRPETHHLIDAAALARMKPGAVLVNTARAGLVDEAALAAALSEGRLAGAALDVYTTGAPQGPLGDCGNVIFTPHLGATTEDALRAVGIGAATTVIEALRGNVPATALNAEALRRAPA